MCDGPKPFISASKTARARLNFDTPGGTAMNVLYFRNVAGWSASDIEDLAVTIHDAWNGNIAQDVNDNIFLTSVEVTDVEVEDGYQFTEPSTDNGANGEQPMPQNVTVAVSFRTGFVGRSKRGRLYHVGLSDNQFVGDKLAVGVAGNIRDHYAAFFAAIEAEFADVHHAVVSYCSGGEWREIADVTNVSSYLVDDTLDSQRRRLLGRGR